MPQQPYETKSSDGAVTYSRKFFLVRIEALQVPEGTAALGFFRQVHYRIPEVYQALLQSEETIRLPALLATVKQHAVRHLTATATRGDAIPHAEMVQLDRDLCRAIHTVSSFLDGFYKVSNAVTEFLVNLLYPFVVDLDMVFRSLRTWRKVADMIQQVFDLRKKPYVFASPSAYVPWQPTHAMLTCVYLPSKRLVQTPIHDVVSQQIRGNFVQVLKALRWYTDPAELGPLWREIRSQFHPESLKGVNALALFELLMPTGDLRSQVDVAREIALFLIDTHHWYTHANWGHIKMNVLGRLANSLRDAFSWDESAPEIFNTLLFSFRLPIGSRDEVRGSMKLGGGNVLSLVINADSVGSFYEMLARSIAKMLTSNVNGELWTQLKRFIAEVDTYIRPTATGTVNSYLLRFFCVLLRSVQERVKAQMKPEHNIPIGYQLDRVAVDTLCSQLFSLVLPCLYSKSATMARHASNAISTIGLLSPGTLFEATLKHVSLGLTTFTEKHQTTASLDILCGVLKPILMEATMRPRLAQFVQEMSPKIIACIDPNDDLRAALANRLIFAIVNLLPISALGDADEVVPSLFDAYVAFLRNMSEDTSILRGFCISTRTLFASATPSAIEATIRKLAREIRSRANASLARTFGALVGSVASANRELALRLLLPVVVDALIGSPALADKYTMPAAPAYCIEPASQPALSDSEAKWWTRILQGLLGSCTAAEVLPHVATIVACAERLVRPPHTVVMAKMGLKIVLSLVRALSQYRIGSWHRLNPADVGSSRGDEIVVYDAKSIDMSWVRPPPEAITAALAIADAYCSAALVLLRSSEAEVARLQRAITSSASLAAASLSDETVEPVTVATLRRHAAWMLRYVVAGGYYVLQARRARFLSEVVAQSGEASPDFYLSKLWWSYDPVPIMPDISHVPLEQPGDKAAVQRALVFEAARDAIDRYIFAPYAATAGGSDEDSGGDDDDDNAEKGKSAVPVTSEVADGSAKKSPPPAAAAAGVSAAAAAAAKTEAHRAKSTNVESKALKIACKLLAVLCSNRSTIGHTHVEVVRVLNDVATKCFPFLERRVPRIVGLLSGEFYQQQRQEQFNEELTREEHGRILDNCRAIATNRYADVQQQGIDFYSTMFSLLPYEMRLEQSGSLLQQFETLLQRAVVSAEEQTRLADAARGTPESSPQNAALKAFRCDPPHFEIRGMMCLVGLREVVENIAIDAAQSFNLVRVLLDYPDMERKSNEERRESLIKSLSAYVAQCRQPTDVVVARANEVLGPQAKSLHITKLVKHMQMLISFYDVRHNASISPASIRVLMQLTLEKHPTVRRYAIAILTVLTIVLKPPTPKHTEPFPVDAHTGGSAIDISRPDYFGSAHVGQLFLPASRVVVGTPVPVEDDLEVARSVLRSGFAPPVPAAGAGLPATPEGVDDSERYRGTWFHEVVLLMAVDTKKFAVTRMHLWKGFARALGPVEIVPALIASASLVMKEAATLFANSNENQTGYFATAAELLCAAVRASKYYPAQRAAAVDAIYKLALSVCSSTVPFEVVAEVVASIANAFFNWAALHEFETLLSGFLQSLNDAVQSSQDVVRYLMFVVNVAYLAPFEFQPQLIARITAAITKNPTMFLYNSFNQVRQSSATLISTCFGAARTQTTLWAGNTTIHDDMVTFARSLLNQLLNPADYIGGDEQLEDGDSAVADEQGVQPSPQEKATTTSPSRPLPPRRENVVKTQQLALAKTILHSFTNVSAHIVSDIAEDLVLAFAKILDIRLPESDDFYKFATRCVKAFSFTRMEPASARRVLLVIADVLHKKLPFGHSRQALLQLLLTVRVMPFQHQHQLDRGEVFQVAAPAVLRCLGHPDRRVRDQGMTTMAVLVKIAPSSVVASFLSECLKDLRATLPPAATPPTSSLVPFALPSSVDPAGAAANRFRRLDSDDSGEVPSYPVNGATSTGASVTPPVLSMNAARATEDSRRLASAVALCSALSAFPESVPKFAPKVMTKLSPLARDRNSEIKTVVKECFQEWWRTHRDRWAFEHQHHFTEQQRDELAELFQTPSYYV